METQSTRWCGKTECRPDQQKQDGQIELTPLHLTI
jgi:hypothetical protein